VLIWRVRCGRRRVTTGKKTATAAEFKSMTVAG
jgi:hypothetical protein